MDDELLLRCLTGKASAREANAVKEWRGASPDNERRYHELERVFGDVRQWYHTGDTSERPAARALIRQAALRHARPNSEHHRWRPSVEWPTAIAASLVFLGVGFSIARFAMRATPPAEQLAAVEFDSDASGLEPVLLNDGSKVVLGPGSRLRIEHRTDAREVSLEGRAEFDVKHDAARPFRVRTAAGVARDLGTRFVVRSQGATMQVAVFEGRVAVGAHGGDLQLEPGQSGIVVAGRPPQLAPPSESRTATDWLRAALVLDGVRVDEVAAQLEAQFHLRVVVADSTLARRVVSAWFVEMPTSRVAVTAICRAIAARCRITDSLVVLSSSNQ